MKLCIILLLLVAAAGLLLSSSYAQQCSPDTMYVPPMENFSYGMIIPKWWYVQEIFYRRAEEVLQPRGWCIQQNVGIDNVFESPLLTEDWTTPGGLFNKDVWWATPAHWVSDSQAVWSVTHSPFELAYITTYAMSDYDTYGVMHWCAIQNESADVPFERIMTFTGSSTPNETLIEEMRGMVAGLGFPTQFSVRVNTTNCEYCWGEECPMYPIYDEKEGKGEEDDFQTEN